MHPPKPAEEPEEFVLLRFDHWRVNVLMPPLLLGLAWLVNHSPLKALLTGFHVWMHEFGHSTAAWITGRRATPLPFGWTPIEPEFSPFVYFGVLALLAVLFWAGWKERKVWPMLIAVVLAVVQFIMTWQLPLHRQEFWWTFCGVGGEFYLSALMMAFFFVQLPEKFRWGACRYVFFLIGATCFLHIVEFWNLVHNGDEAIPMGSLVNGEDDEGGDMNTLLNLYGWKYHQIRNTYQYLGYWCWAVLGAVYVGFALRLNAVADWVAGKFQKEEA
ncbi:M50 family metallopeptidase [Oleiharenicola lentus]|uniref:M50 family metallopeptidase n=1 Tax=Oleiharenicola lentus TaxID=2508720 RepID=UPI003F66FD1F